MEVRERLSQLGFDPALLAGGSGGSDLRARPARVIGEGRGAYVVDDARGELRAEVAGRLRFAADGRGDFPVVGDWVLVEGEQEPVRIRRILRRRTLLQRKAASGREGAQPIAANMDMVFAMHAVDRGSGVRRLERSMVIVRESGARGVVLLSKCDLLPSGAHGELEEEVCAVLPGVEVVLCSVITGAGLDRVRAHVRSGVTLCCIGPSGAGKSTLINALAGHSALPTAEVRDRDARGRHTTTRRQLLLLPGGGMVIDTPGMRELGLWQAGDGLEETFPEIGLLAEGCRFRDCTHLHEPACAVRIALEEGRLSAERFESYRRLRDEAGRRDARPGRERR